MTINGRSFSFAFLINVLSPFLVYSAEAPGIRGFAMGERYAAVLRQEQALGEFTLQNSAEGSRLRFRGRVFGEQASLTYSFRSQRLTSLRYVWRLPGDKTLFISNLQGLLTRKYKAVSTNTIAVPEGSALSYLYAERADSPALLAQLEILSSAEGALTLSLEFRAPDPDAVLIKKILSEDL